MKSSAVTRSKGANVAPSRRGAEAPQAAARGRAAKAAPLAAAPGDDQVVMALGARVKMLRLEARLTLEQLALRSGVSRAMLSKVERGEKSCTVAILSRISRGLSITLSSLLGVEADPNVSVVFPKAKRIVFVDPETGFERHLLTAMHVDNDVELLLHRIPPGKSSGEMPPYTSPTRKYIVVQEGALTIRIGSVEHRLSTGDAAFFEVKEPYMFFNEGRVACSYYLVIVRRR